MIYILKKGIREDILEFSNLDADIFWAYTSNLYTYFETSKKKFIINNSIKYISGRLSLCEFRNSKIIPICIGTKDTNGTLTVLIDKDYINNNKEIKELTEEYLKERTHKVKYVNDLSNYIFENIKIPAFDTIKDMKNWLNNIKTRWVKNERKKITKAEKKKLTTA